MTAAHGGGHGQQQLQTRHSVVNMHIVLRLRTCTLEPEHISNSQFSQVE